MGVWCETCSEWKILEGREGRGRVGRGLRVGVLMGTVTERQNLNIESSSEVLLGETFTPKKSFHLP